VGRLPWLTAPAIAASDAAAARCLDAFADGCAQVRDAAVALAREARARGQRDELAPRRLEWHASLDEAGRDDLCGRWEPWIGWLDDHGLDAAAACPVCVPG